MTTKNDKGKKSAVHKKLRRRKITMGVIAFLALVALCLFTPLFHVSEVSVSGCKVLKPQNVIEASGIKQGDNFLFVNTEKAEEAINALGYVGKVEVKRKFFTRIEIEVTECEVAAYISVTEKVQAENKDSKNKDSKNKDTKKKDPGKTYVGINEKGKVLSVDKSDKFKPGKAVISGLTLTDMQKGDYVKATDTKKYNKVMELIEQLSGRGLLLQVKKIDIAKSGSLSFILNTDTRVLLGDGSDMDYRMEFVSEILEVQTNMKGGELDVSDTANVIYHPEEGGAKK